MKNISDERLEKMLANYCEADYGQSFEYHPAPKKEKVIPVARFSKAAVAAASLVLVSVLSMTLYFLFGNKISTPIAVVPSPQSATTPSAPAGVSGGDNAQNQDGSAEPTQGQSLIQQIISGRFPVPTETVSAASPTEKKNPQPTEKPAGKPSVKATEKPGQKATEKPSPLPTERPSLQSTEKPVADATQPEPEPTTYLPTEPQMPPWNDDPDPPTEGGEPGIFIPAPVEFYGSFDRSCLPADHILYCKIYDSAGKLLGDRDLYASEHLAEIIRVTDTAVLAEYSVPEGMIWDSGYYNYVFYDSRGTLLTQGQEYIEV